MEMAAMRRKQRDYECIPEIRKMLLRFRHDPEFRGNGNRVPIKQFAKLAQVSRELLYILMRDPSREDAWDALYPATRDRILAAGDLVIKGGLRWKRNPFWRATMPDGSPPPPIKMRFAVATRKKRTDDHPVL